MEVTISPQKFVPIFRQTNIQSGGKFNYFLFNDYFFFSKVTQVFALTTVVTTDEDKQDFIDEVEDTFTIAISQAKDRLSRSDLSLADFQKLQSNVNKFKKIIVNMFESVLKVARYSKLRSDILEAITFQYLIVKTGLSPDEIKHAPTIALDGSTFPFNVEHNKSDVDFVYELSDTLFGVESKSSLGGFIDRVRRSDSIDLINDSRDGEAIVLQTSDETNRDVRKLLYMNDLQHSLIPALCDTGLYKRADVEFSSYRSKTFPDYKEIQFSPFIGEDGIFKVITLDIMRNTIFDNLA